MPETSLSKLSTKQPSVMVVDDHANVSKLVDAYIGKAGIESIDVQHANDLEIACLLIKKKQPDLILLDNLLPPHFDFRFSVERLIEVYTGPIVLFSGEIPESVGTEEIDQHLAGVLSKDDLATTKFVDVLNEHVLSA